VVINIKIAVLWVVILCGLLGGY